jgi:hypothetical protein
MKKYLPLILFLCTIKLAIHLVGNQNYGFHRDELLHLSVGEKLDWGYFEFPPLIALIGKFAHFLFGYSLGGIRIFATLAGIGILVLCCLIAKEIGGKTKAILLSGICILGFLPFYRNHTLFQPVAFDQFFWTLGFYFAIRYLNTEKAKYLLFIGLTAGLGMMSKHTFLIWGFGTVVGLLFHRKASAFKNKWLYISGIVALLIWLPNFLWQYEHDFPLLKHMQKLKEIQSEEAHPLDFATDQLEFLFTFIVSIIGLAASFLNAELKKYRPIGIAVIVIFATMWYEQSKSYYFFAAYPVLFALGSVMIEKLLRRKPVWSYAVALAIIAPVPFYLPMLTPILPIDSYVRFADLKPEKDGRVILSDDYADMFGWTQQVKLIDSIYKALPEQDQSHCMIWAENYGEAGAIKTLGKQYGLPDPVCLHGSFWLLGTGNADRKICLSIGNEKETLQHFYSDIRLVKIVRHKYAIDEENNIPVYLCRNQTLDLKQKWPDLEKYIFD